MALQGLNQSRAQAIDIKTWGFLKSLREILQRVSLLSCSFLTVTVGGSHVVRAARDRAREPVHATQQRVRARGRGCCCYDATAAAPWEEGERSWMSFSAHSGREAAADRGRTPGQSPGISTVRSEPVTAARSLSACLYCGSWTHTQPGVVCQPRSPQGHDGWRDSSHALISPNQVPTGWKRNTTPPSLLHTCDSVDLLFVLFPSFLLPDHHGREDLQRAADDDVGAHAGCGYDPAGGGPGEAGGAGAGALRR